MTIFNNQIEDEFELASYEGLEIKKPIAKVSRRLNASCSK